MAKRKMARRKTVVKKAKKPVGKAAARKNLGRVGGMAGKRGAKKAAAKKASSKKAAKAKPASKKAAPKKTPAAKAVGKASPKALGKKAPSKGAPKKAARKAAKAPIRRAAPILKRIARVAAPIAAAAPKKAPKSARPQRAARPAPIRGAIPSSLEVVGGSSAAKSGRVEMLQHIKERTETSPAITAGDVDADWQLAYSSGDEAPGGDNPTPDQDIVDEIGEALGVNYEDGEELKGAAKIEDRDKHRWELDPASKDDFDDQ